MGALLEPPSPFALPPPQAVAVAARRERVIAAVVAARVLRMADRPLSAGSGEGRRAVAAGAPHRRPLVQALIQDVS
ncbi:hypothetical protein GCM10010336_43200 [Streptomyces goshikiensis]|nr:hypothetical protein GCM10010336_43200 [Streptomyces goshikiensis]